jgi:hypothetical protein
VKLRRKLLLAVVLALRPHLHKERLEMSWYVDALFLSLGGGRRKGVEMGVVRRLGGWITRAEWETSVRQYSGRCGCGMSRDWNWLIGVRKY